MLNRIILIGRLTKDPDLRYTTNGKEFCYFTLAVERNYKNQEGNRDVDFLNIITWGKQALSCAKHLGKGRLVAVEGSLQIRKNEKKGRTYINPEIIASHVQFLDWPDDSNKSDTNTVPEGPPPNYEGEDDDYDVPF